METLTLSDADILRNAADIVDRGWCQNDIALAKATPEEMERAFAHRGREASIWFVVSCLNKRAERYCMGGAIMRAAHPQQAPDRFTCCLQVDCEYCKRGNRLLRESALAMGLPAVWFFNDSDDVTQAMVSAKLRWLAAGGT